MATAPSATRAAVSRALARSSTGRASSRSYFCMPTRSAWPGPRPGQRLVARLGGQHVGVDRVGRHHRLPLGPLGVADPDRDRAAHACSPCRTPPVSSTSSCSKLHPGTAAVAEAAAGQVARRPVGGGHLDPGRQPVEDGDEGRPVRLPSGHPAQHGAKSLKPDRVTVLYMPVAPSFDALILAGGAGQRLDGADKPALWVGSRSLLQHVLDGVAEARRIVVVGPPRLEAARFGARTGADVRRCQEQPPGGGPVAAVAAGLPETDADVVLVLAADMPWVSAAVPALLSALSGGADPDVAVLTDAGGRRNHVAAAWRRGALAAVVDGLGPPDGLAARMLYRDAVVVEVGPGDGLPEHASEDCDTWPDVARARSRAEEELP